jgi:hypothetical protein
MKQDHRGRCRDDGDKQHTNAKNKAGKYPIDKRQRQQSNGCPDQE